MERALALLRRHGLDEDALRCPPDLPGHGPTRAPLADGIARAGSR
ncbi:hypothetical protein GCM10020366_71060 [Saccharopolyspora gregorii]|uniref:Uncharacterized protein n=1 Tax=Saccharopolyspora gregorii TaxID=33914 RepID=A0ABP6S316_9PSEU